MERELEGLRNESRELQTSKQEVSRVRYNLESDLNRTRAAYIAERRENIRLRARARELFLISRQLKARMAESNTGIQRVIETAQCIEASTRSL